MTLFEKQYEPPKSEPGSGDELYAVVKAAAGSVPILGDAAQYLLDHILGPPLLSRQAQWMNDVAEGLRRLEAGGRVDAAKLPDNQAFIDCVAAATQSAIRTSQVHKREALRNAILNSAWRSTIELSVQQIFLSLIDKFSDWHLAILQLFQAPADWRDTSGRRVEVAAGFDTDASSVVVAAFPELGTKQALYELVWSDLVASGLVENNSLGLHNRGEGSSVTKKRTTLLGDEFLSFIKSPIG